MTKLTKLSAGIAFALIAGFAVASPSFATDCGCDDAYYDDWDYVGVEQWLDNDDTMEFDLDFDAHETVDLSIVSDLVQHHTVDLDIRVEYPNGRVVVADEVGDDILTIRTGQGGTFRVMIDNVDDEFGTNFTLYAEEY